MVDIEKFRKDKRVRNIIDFLVRPEIFNVSKKDYFYSKNHDEEDAVEVEEIIRYVYFKTSVWCNENGYMIVEGDDCYKVQKIPELSKEEKAEILREERDNLLVKVVDPVVTNPLRWNELTEAEQSKYRAYRLYLLDIPQQEEFPDIEIKSFEEFLK